MRLPRFRGPSWREAFLALLSFSVTSAFVWAYLLSGWIRDDARFVQQWFELWERCRISVETRTKLDTNGLSPIAIIRSPLDQPSPTERVLGRPGERFAIVASESTDGGLTRWACDVVDQDWGRPMSQREQALLLLAFMKQRALLIVHETHEQRDPWQMIESPSAGFGPILLNPANCEVIAAVFFSENSGSFSSAIAERDRPGERPCGTGTPPSPPATQS